jgi:hypothetical protein
MRGMSQEYPTAQQNRRGGNNNNQWPHTGTIWTVPAENHHDGGQPTTGLGMTLNLSRLKS